MNVVNFMNIFLLMTMCWQFRRPREPITEPETSKEKLVNLVNLVNFVMSWIGPSAQRWSTNGPDSPQGPPSGSRNYENCFGLGEATAQ